MKTRMTISVLLFLSMFGSAVAQTQAPAASQSAQPTIDPQKEQLIRHLLDLMHLNQTMEKVMGPMMSQMSRTIEAGAPANEKVHKFSELVNQRLVAKMKTADLSPYYIPVYDKYYTPDEIKALIAFYESPVGQKSLEVQASLSLELMCNSWGLRSSNSRKMRKTKSKRPSGTRARRRLVFLRRACRPAASRWRCCLLRRGHRS